MIQKQNILITGSKDIWVREINNYYSKNNQIETFNVYRNNKNLLILKILI